jgi:hypothetical protein
MKISYVFHQPGKFSARLTRGEVVMGSGDKVIFLQTKGMQRQYSLHCRGSSVKESAFSLVQPGELRYRLSE